MLRHILRDKPQNEKLEPFKDSKNVGLKPATTSSRYCAKNSINKSVPAPNKRKSLLTNH